MDAAEVCLLGVATALPGRPVDNAELANRFGMDRIWSQWVDTFVGTRTRHLAVDLETGEIRSTLTDLAETAARRVMSEVGLVAADVDLMVLATATPTRLMPATVNEVADRLGINDIPTFQIQSGCAGAVQALDVARRLLASSGRRHALVLAGDVCAKHFDLGADLRAMPPEELVNVVVFGDGAGAALLRAEPGGHGAALRSVQNTLTGLGREPGQVVEWFGMAERDAAGHAVREDYAAILESVPLMTAEVLKEVLTELDWAEADVDFLLPPQLSATMTQRILAELGCRGARTVTCVDRTGNTGNALPFLQLEQVLGEMTSGDRAVGIAIESSKWIKTGFALEKV